MSNFSISSVPHAAPLQLTTPQPLASSMAAWVLTTQLLSQVWSFITIGRLITILLVLGNLKNIPLIWHVRLANAFRFCTRNQRPKSPPTSAQLFQPLITTNHAPLMEIDLNFHKSNSSYFSDVDIARTHLACTLFSTGFEYMRGGTAAINKGNRSVFNLALGAVSCSFKKELKPYEEYEMWTRVLTWDEKWIYIVTHFVRKGAVLPRTYTLYPQQNSRAQLAQCQDDKLNVHSESSNEAVVATALSKCVFKQGRRTIPPAFMLLKSGLLPCTSLDEALPRGSEGNPLSSCASSDSGIDVAESVEATDLELIEAERQRGMRVAYTLAAQGQQALEMEFSGEKDALGKHTDGAGIVGLASTFTQLAHLTPGHIL